MDLQYETSALTSRDRSWLVAPTNDASFAHSATMLIAGATKATHYPDGYVKTGTLMAKYTSGGNSGLWAPYVHDHAGGLGLDTVAGIVIDGFDIPAVTSALKVAGSVYTIQTHLQIYLDKLPGLLENDGTTAHTPVAGDLPAAWENITGF